MAVTISLSSLGTAYTENFDSLSNFGTSSFVPAGWAFLETGTNANGSYTAGNGSSNVGDTYSFGPAGSTERALGGIQAGLLDPTIGAFFVNDTGGTITSLAISYTGEQWRLGQTGRSDQLDFQYSTDAVDLGTGTWTDVNTLDFASPSTSGTAGATDGNNASFRTDTAATVSGLSIAPGATFAIRFLDADATGPDDGLAVDDFSLTPNGVLPAAPTANDDDFATNEAAAIGAGLNVFNNNGHGADTDPDSPSFTVATVNGSAADVGTAITLASGAKVTLNADGTFSYDPNHAFDLLPAAGSGATNLTAADTFTYTDTDGVLGSNTATVTVTISGVDSNDLLQGSFAAGTRSPAESATTPMSCTTPRRPSTMRAARSTWSMRKA